MEGIEEEEEPPPPPPSRPASPLPPPPPLRSPPPPQRISFIGASEWNHGSVREHIHELPKGAYKAGYLLKMGGGTSMFGRRNWKRRLFVLQCVI
jgi:hypothetical protein